MAFGLALRILGTSFSCWFSLAFSEAFGAFFYLHIVFYTKKRILEIIEHCDGEFCIPYHCIWWSASVLLVIDALAAKDGNGGR